MCRLHFLHIGIGLIAQHKKPADTDICMLMTNDIYKCTELHSSQSSIAITYYLKGLLAIVVALLVL